MKPFNLAQKTRAAGAGGVLKAVNSRKNNSNASGIPRARFHEVW